MSGLPKVMFLQQHKSQCGGIPRKPHRAWSGPQSPCSTAGKACPPVAQMLLARAFWKLLSFRNKQMHLAKRKQRLLGKQQEMNKEGTHFPRPGRGSRVFCKTSLEPESSLAIYKLLMDNSSTVDYFLPADSRGLVPFPGTSPFTRCLYPGCVGRIWNGRAFTSIRHIAKKEDRGKTPPSF